MKLVSTLPLVFLVASSTWAQHGASAGAGHTGASFSSGRSFTMSSTGASPGAFHAGGSVAAYRPSLASPSRSLYSSPIGPPPFGGTQPTPGKRYPYPTGGHRPYYYSSGLYVVPGYLNYGYGYSGYPDDSSYGDQPAAPAAADVNAQGSAPDDAYQQAYSDLPPRPPYQPQAAASAEVPDQPQVTLLFKDGRPPQQVQNYAVTRSTLYVLDGARRREIPLDDIDLPQTEKTNRDAGVDFEIPAGID
jgi:hypothetical protein